MRFRFRFNNYFIYIPILVLVFLLSIFLTQKILYKNESIKSVFDTSEKSTIVEKLLPKPTPLLGQNPSGQDFFLQEITIPALRARSYTSELGELEKYQEAATYTSYTTSYVSDGLKVNGLLTIPKSDSPDEKFPAIVFVHGYIAPSIYKTTERYVAYVDYLARNGFVVFKIDLRGHGNSEGEAGGAYYSSDYVVDTLNAYKALSSANFVDGSSIGLWGHSMSGNVIFRAFVAKQNIPAIVIWAGAGFTYRDLQDYGLSDGSYRPPDSASKRAQRRQQMRETYGEFNSDHWFWKMVAPTNYLMGVNGAVELHHAVNDNVVSIEYSRNLIKILDETQISHQLFEYPTGGHNIESPSFNVAMKRTVDFFHKYLK